MLKANPAFGGLDGLVAAAQKEGTLNLIATPREWADYGDAIDTFSKAFGKEVMDRKPLGVTPATPAQVAEITRIVGILNIDNEQLTDWLNKDSAEVVEDLPTDRAAAMIEFLNKKLKGEIK